MDFADIIQILAILIECGVVAVAVLIATRNKKMYGWYCDNIRALCAL